MTQDPTYRTLKHVRHTQTDGFEYNYYLTEYDTEPKLYMISEYSPPIDADEEEVPMEIVKESHDLDDIRKDFEAKYLCVDMTKLREVEIVIDEEIPSTEAMTLAKLDYSRVDRESLVVLSGLKDERITSLKSKIKDIQASLNFHKAQSEERRACIEGLNVTTERLNATIDSLNARIADLETEIGLNAAIADGSLYTDTVKGDLKSKGEAVAREILKDYHPDIDFNDPDFVQKVTQAHKLKT